MALTGADMHPSFRVVLVVAIVGLMSGGCSSGRSAGDGAARAQPKLASPSSAPTHSGGDYRFVKPPLIVREDFVSGASDVTVYFRMNRRLPQGSYGTVDGQRPADRIAKWFVLRNDRCYRQYAGGTKRSPWVGTPLGTPATFALHIRGVGKALKAVAGLMAPLPSEKNANGIGNEGLAYEHRLHCRRSHPHDGA
jgi:hypothetical protein